VESPGERITLYKKMISCREDPEVEKLRSELTDRFGPIPEPAETLFRLIHLKMEATKLKVVSITETDLGIIFSWPQFQGTLPINLFQFAKDHPSLIEILPPAPRATGAKENRQLEILFKDDTDEEGFKKARRFLKISERYVTIGGNS